MTTLFFRLAGLFGHASARHLCRTGGLWHCSPTFWKGDTDTMKSFTICAGAAVLAMSFASADGALATNAPGSHILVIDRHAVMTGSKLGENIRQQILAYEDKAQNELGAEGQALQNQIQAAGAKKSPALQAKETAFRQKVTERQSLIQGGEMAARKRYLAELGAVGFLIAVIFLTLIGFRTIRAGALHRDPNSRWLGFACAGSLAAILVHSLADFNLYVVANAMLLAWVCGLAGGIPDAGKFDEG